MRKLYTYEKKFADAIPELLPCNFSDILNKIIKSMKFKVLHLYSEKTLLNKGFYVRDLSDSYLREGLHMEDFWDYKFLIIGKNYSYTLIKESEPLDDPVGPEPSLDEEDDTAAVPGEFN